MKKPAMELLLVGMLTVCGSMCFAATEYVIVNDNNGRGNTLSVYRLDTTTGDLSQVTVLKTGGDGLSTIEDYAYVEQAITPSGSCIFAMDDGTHDIASFSKATNYAKVGNFSNSAVFYYGSLALTPDGRFLYATYDESENIGAWAVNPDCSLTFLAAYVPSGGAGSFVSLKVTPNGAYLVLPVGSGAEQFGIDPNTGLLTDIGFRSLDSIHRCANGSCGMSGLDFTRDSRVVVFAGGLQGTPTAFVMEITPTGLVNPQVVFLTNSASVTIPLFPFFSAAGYAGSGHLYFGARGNGGPGYAGVITTNFSEGPPGLTLANATRLNFLGEGPIAAIGNLMVVAEYPNTIGVYSINSDGSLTQLSATVDNRVLGPFSLSVFPNTR